MRANQSFGAKWNEGESQHLEFKKLHQTSENQTPSWLLLQTSITKQKYQVANNLISNHPKPLDGTSIDRCPDMSRSHVGAGLVASIVQRTFHEPSTLNQRNHRLTRPTTHIYGQHLPHKSQTQWVPEKVKLFIVGLFNNPLRIASLKGSIFLNKWECASFFVSFLVVW